MLKVLYAYASFFTKYQQMSKVILGGGLAGLSAAYYLLKKPPPKITLIESTSRTGGWIKSSKQKNQFIFEQGPRTIRPKGPQGLNTLQLIEELGLTQEVIPIVSSHPAATKRMIYAKGSLHLLPTSFLGLFKLQKPFTKPLIWHLLNDLKAERKVVADEPIYDFIERRFGSEVADYLISPLICGICAGNANEVSVKFLMKNLFDYEQRYGSISLGFIRNFFKKKTKDEITSELAVRAKNERWSIYSFNSGCETLPLALRNHIEGKIDLRLNSKCTQLKFDGNNVVLKLQNNETITTNHVISAIPALNLGHLLKNQHPELAQNLTKLVKTVSLAVVNLDFKHNFLKSEAFGLLVAPKEKLPVLGIIFDSCCFPKNKCGTALTVMMGGYWFEEHFGSDPTEGKLLEIAINQMQNILGTSEQPEGYQVSILKCCMPQYVVGHDRTLDSIKKYIRKHNLPISLCGASYYGVGINDVILSAKNAVNDL